MVRFGDHQNAVGLELVVGLHPVDELRLLQIAEVDLENVAERQVEVLSLASVADRRGLDDAQQTVELVVGFG